MKAKIYAGTSIEDKCRKQLHPFSEVLKAKSIIDSKENIMTYSNSPDFISTIKHYGEKIGYECEFFLDGKSFGNDIEPLFEDFNKALDLLDTITK
jgi:hypothetical protein